MKILIIGGNSYIARSFIRRYADQFECSVVKRDDTFHDYFDLSGDSFTGYDAVLNCVAMVHTRPLNPLQAKRINTDLPYHLARLAKAAQVPLFIQFSTVAVYGDAIRIDPTTPESPMTLYGRTKHDADCALMSLQDASFAVSLIRPPMVYGPDAPGNMKNLIRLIRTVPVLPFDYRGNHRSMIYIDNLLCALKKVIETRMEGIVLVRDDEMPSLYELCRLIVTELKIKRVLFTLPSALITWLSRFSSLPFAKLYGSLIIDDTVTRQTLGTYAGVSTRDAIAQTLHPKAAT